MHFTGTVWRPPYEAASLLIEVTAGCTHHRCKFCTLYNELPFPFRMSPLADVEADLLEAQTALHSPVGRWSAALQGLPAPAGPKRAFLVGANPFVLKAERLLELARLVKQYFPSVGSVGCFARITDVGLKTDGELEQLRAAGYDGLTIGVETGDGPALAFMDKGYGPEDILAQCRRLDRAGIHYSFFYLAGISGAGRGEAGAKATAAICNRLHPTRIGVNMLTVYPDSALYQEIQRGSWQEESEIEKYKEIRTLLENLEIPTRFAALGASNAVQFQGALPQEKAALAATLDQIIEGGKEDDLREYRKNLPHL